MATEIFLGEPPANIKKWIQEHTAPVTHADTRLTFGGGQIVSLNISETLGDLWKEDSEGEDATGELILNYEGSDKLFNSDLVSVDIGNTVMNISQYAFAGCNGLMSVTIPNSVISIGRSVFYECTSLDSVMIGSGVTSIGDEVFYWCDSLTNVTFLEKTLAEVQNIEDGNGVKQYPWGIEDTSIINVA